MVIVWMVWMSNVYQSYSFCYLMEVIVLDVGGYRCFRGFKKNRGFFIFVYLFVRIV